MRYLIDDWNAEPEESLALYRATVSWAARQSDYFVLSLQPDIYDSQFLLTKICALGEVERVPVPEPTPEENLFAKTIKELFHPIANVLEVRFHQRPTELLKVYGKPSEDLITELTTRQAPERAIAGDLCPVEDVEMLIGDGETPSVADRCIYILNDYGRTQVLDMTSEEMESLQEHLLSAGLNPSRLVLAPKYISNNSIS
ncbi:MAG TPA: hypothetical protein VK203_18635 [Nostocaceae cyanobacterium]|nr:hypothetical protein [Nostocaceae cyanobacterium]